MAVREARLRPEWADLYPSVRPDVWHVAAELVPHVLRHRLTSERRAGSSPAASCDDEHFEFRGGRRRDETRGPACSPGWRTPEARVGQRRDVAQDRRRGDLWGHASARPDRLRRPAATQSHHPLRSQPHGISSPRPCRQRDLGLGRRPRARRAGAAADGGSRPWALPRRSTSAPRWRTWSGSGWRPTGDRPRSSGAAARRFARATVGRLYAAAVERLARSERVYACDCSRREIALEGGDALQPGDPLLRPLPDSRARPAKRPRDPRGAAGRNRDVQRRSARRDQPGAGASSAATCCCATASGNWTYQLAVVVDDLRHEVDLVIRGEDLLSSTGRQISLGRMLGRNRAAGVPSSPADP